MKKISVLTCLLLLVSISALAGRDGRIIVDVTDEKGEPLEDVTVTVTSAEIQFSKQYSTNRKGKSTITLLDASRDYTIKLEKEGYATIFEEIDPEVGTILRKEWTMVPGAPAPTIGEELGELTGRGKAVKLYNEAVVHYQANELDEALTKFKEALAEDAEIDVAYAAIARIHVQREEWEEARVAAEVYVERVPDDPIGPRLLYDAYWKLDRKDDAARLLETMLEKDPGPSTATRVFNVGVEAVRAQDLDLARESFELALKLYPDLKEAHLNLAQVLAAQGDFEGSIANADAFLAKQPGHPRALLMKFISHRAVGEQEAADAAFAQLASADPALVADQLVNEGTAQFNANQTDLAIAAFEKALEAEPEHPKAHYMLGLCMIGKGSIDEGKDLLKKFLELAPDDSDAETARAMLQSL